MFAYALLWKEFTLRRRAWIQTPFEFVLIAFSVYAIRSVAIEEIKQWKNRDASIASTDNGNGTSPKITGRMLSLAANLPAVVFYPSVNFTNEVMNYDEYATENSSEDKNKIAFSRGHGWARREKIYQVLPLKNELELAEFVSKYSSRVEAAFIFYEQNTDKYLTESSKIEDGIRIKIKPTFFVGHTDWALDKSISRIVANVPKPATLETFVNMVETVVLRALAIQLDVKNINNYQSETPEIVTESYRELQISVYAVFLSAGTVLTLYILVKRIATEKTTKMRELLNLTGMRSKTYNDSIFVFHIAILLPYALVCAYFVSFLCDPLLAFFVYVWFAVASILYAMAFTVFMNNVTLAKTIFVILWLGIPMLAMYYYGLPLNDGSNEVYTIIFCIFIPPTFAVGTFHQICDRYFRVYRVVLPLKDLFHHIPTLTYITPGHVTLALGSQIFFCAIIFAYVGEIWPWQDGIPKPWHFPVSQYFPKEKSSNVKQNRRNAKYFEPPPNQSNCVISVEGVTKRFTRDVLKGVYLQVFRGQITVLLGHNGAGKTTLMSIMTGLFPPTSGRVMINGYSVQTSTEMARKGVGLCPQVNIQYETLTIEEHLYFFGLMKGYSRAYIGSEIDRILKLLNLEQHRKLSPNALSGGMKRKLQLAMAFIGGSNILILDEPSSGLDIETRRVVWDMLLAVREKYVILVTTHHMEEADCLGDRIAIMSQGDIICSGTPMFLKNVFGVGYFIRAAKMDNFNANDYQSLLAKHLTTAALQKDTKNEVIFTFKKEETPKLPNLLDELDVSKQNVGVSSVGITVTSMDDVFLKVGLIFDNIDVNDDSKLPEIKKLTKPSSPNSVIIALLEKRFHNAKRKPLTLLCFLLFVLALSVGFAWISSGREVFEAREWQKEVNFAAFGYKSAKGVCVVQNIRFCNLVKQIGDSFSIAFDVKNMSLDDLSESISPVNNLVGIGGNFSENGEDTGLLNDIKIYYPPTEVYTYLIATTIVSNALYNYANNLTSKTNFITATFNPQRTVNTNFWAAMDAEILLIPLMFLILGLYPMLYPAMEKNTNVKLLQLMTGVSFFQYWFSNLVFDFLLLSFLSLPFFIIVISSHFMFSFVTVISGFKTLGFFAIVISTYFVATITMSYFLSLFFDGIAIVLLVKLSIFIVVTAIGAINVQIIRDSSAYFNQYIMPVYPLFGMTRGVQNVTLYAIVDDYCSKLFTLWPDYCRNIDNFDDATAIDKCCEDFVGETVGWKFVLLEFTQTSLFVGFFVALLVLEHVFEARKKIKFTDPQYKAPKSEDSDVSAMRSKTEDIFKKNIQKNVALSTLNITKTYSQTVVDHLSFMVESKQCFGLLGVNGAGKSTTFKMLIAEISMTYGESFIGSYSVFQNSNEYQKSIGYCPQFDAFVNNLTGREMLYLFARLRGYGGRQLKDAVENIIKLVDLQDHAYNVADNYSGGNKRKLSIGMAVIGFPRLMFFDEPTAGVDPVARRKVWKIIEACKQQFGSSLILTSHAMDECEYLCSIIAIMVKGTFRCMGSTQQLKEKFGKGVTITLKLDANLKNMEKVKQEVASTLPKATLKDSHTTQLTYHFDDASVTLGNVFRILESIKVKHKLEDYQVTDSDLEQIFLSFARRQ